MGRKRVSTARRGQSETFAIAVVMVLAFVSALLVAGIGSLTLESGQQAAETERSVRVLTELDSKASLVALEGGDAALIEVASRSGRGQFRVDDGGRIRLVLRDTENDTATELADSTLGTVAYANGDQRVAYQGGAVWRRTEGADGSVMVSPPEVHYRGETLTLPMIRVSGDDTSVSAARIGRVDTERVWPDAGSDRRNPVSQNRELDLYVTSEYYRGWAQFFTERVDRDVRVYDNRTVKVTLSSPSERFVLSSGLVSVGTSERIDMQGSGNDPTFVDSYDSTNGSYDETRSGNGTIQAANGLSLGGTSYVDGNVNADGQVKLQGNSTIYGNARHRGLTVSGQNSGVTGWEAENASEVSVPPVDNVVQQRVTEICTPENTTTVSDGETIGDDEDESAVCIDGDFTLDSGDSLTFDLADGNVSFAVNGDIDLSNADVSVVNNEGNDHGVKIWLGGNQVSLNSANVSVPGDDSRAVRLYGPSDTSVELLSHSTFTGVIFAPAEAESGGSIRMKSGSELFGSAVVGTVDMNGGSAVHYDEGLDGFVADRRGIRAATELSYLHVTINEVRIEDG